MNFYGEIDTPNIDTIMCPYILIHFLIMDKEI